MVVSAEPTATATAPASVSDVKRERTSPVPPTWLFGPNTFLKLEQISFPFPFVHKQRADLATMNEPFTDNIDAQSWTTGVGGPYPMKLMPLTVDASAAPGDTKKLLYMKHPLGSRNGDCFARIWRGLHGRGPASYLPPLHPALQSWRSDNRCRRRCYHAR